MVLYFVRALKTGLVKCRMSDSFDARPSKLRREGPDELEVLKVFHGERDYVQAIEKEIHAELKESFAWRVVSILPGNYCHYHRR